MYYIIFLIDIYYNFVNSLYAFLLVKTIIINEFSCF